MKDSTGIDDRDVNVPTYSMICTFCKHCTGKRECAAFDEIPMDIWLGHNDHTQPYEGDRGIRFERRE